MPIGRPSPCPVAAFSWKSVPRSRNHRSVTGKGASDDDEPSADSWLRAIAHAPETPPREAEPEPKRLAHFRVVARLGAGGMGVVYKARDEKLQRDVALKVLPSAFASDPERRRRLLQEARSAAALTHPNIATIYDVGEAEGRVFLAMELVEGETLRARLARGVPPLEETMRIARQILGAVARAHGKGIVHRDLKPDNVMLDAHGEVRVLDFGLAKLREPDGAGSSPSQLGLAETALSPTEEGSVVGTPGYMAPEQARGGAADARADVFAIGVMLYEMVAGARPFAGKSPFEVLVAVDRDLPTPLEERALDVPADFAAVVARCLAKAPQDRYADASEVIAALAGSSGTRVLGRRPRWRGIVIAAAAVGMAAAAFRLMPRQTSGAPSPPASSPSPAPREQRGYKARRLTTFTEGNYIQEASLDPSQFVYGDNEGFWTQPIAGGAPRRLGTPPLEQFERAVRIVMLADGKNAVLEVTRGGHYTLFLAPLAGAPARLLRKGVGEEAVVSPDGARLAVVRGDRLIIGPLDDGDASATVALTIARVGNPCFSPDGRFVAYVQQTAPASISTVNVESGVVRRIVGDVSFDAAEPVLAWPEARRLVFARGGERLGGSTLSEITLDDLAVPTSGPREIWRTDSLISGLGASGDRMTVVLSTTQDDVFVVGLAPDARRLVGAPRRVTASDARDAFPAWLPDARLAFWSDRDSQSALYAQPTDGGAASLLVPDPVVRSTFAVLGTGALVFMRPVPTDGGGDTLPARRRFMVGKPGGPERELGRELEPSSSTLRCGAHPSRCVLGSLHDGVLAFAWMDMATGRSASPFFESQAQSSSFDISPDGSVLAAVDGRLLTVVHTDTGEALTTSVGASVAPNGQLLQGVTFTPDGRTLVVSGMYCEWAPYCLIAADLHGRGSVLRVSKHEWMATPAVSTDGRTLAFRQKSFDNDVWLVEPR